MPSEQVRLRTDVVLSSVMGIHPPFSEYVRSLDGNKITKQDVAVLATAAPEEPSPYSMKPLNSMLDPSEMVLPVNMQQYLQGHTKISTSYLSDWPVASPENRFGEHHPFGMKSNSCPLLHGAAHGEPHYIDHVMSFIEKLDGHGDRERSLKLSLDEKTLFGDPVDSMSDHFQIDRNRPESFKSDDEYMESKRKDLSDSYGLLPYLFGMEFQTANQRDAALEILSDLASSPDQDSVEAKYAIGKFQEKAGIKWDRLLRNWRDRFTPLAAWWIRPSDRSGPTSPAPSDSVYDTLTSPLSGDEDGHNYHWWEPFQYWGGVGRSIQSLSQIMSQSYPDIFGQGWLKDFLINGISLEGQHMISGSHFPAKANMHPEMSHVLTSASQMDMHEFERKRSNWSHASNHHHLHPSEINGQGSRTVLPSDQMRMSRFGRSLMRVSEMGTPMIGLFRTEHPNSNADFHELHNQHFTNSDDVMVRAVTKMAADVYRQFGPDVLAPADVQNIDANTVARGNIQQLVAAANYQLMRGKGEFVNMDAETPMIELGMANMVPGKMGPVSTSSEAVVPPIFNTGNTDAWGHEMPATLTWKWNEEEDKMEFGVTEQPFTLLQRTAHEGLVSAADISYVNRTISSKKSEIGALAPNEYGYPTMTMDLHKADDYEPTGVFTKTIEPAHTVKDINDMEHLKGFSGDWVVQKKPKGKHLLVERKGRKMKPTNLPEDVKKSLGEIKGDFVFDGYLSGNVLHVVDLLLHKGTDMHMEPLEDRVNALRTMYNTTENVHFPSPSNCNNSDDDGLIKTIASMKGDDLLVRDAKSTFMKGKDIHPKWVLLAQDEVTKSSMPYPLPEIDLREDALMLHYPAIYDPVVVKMNSDDNGIYIESYDGMPHLVKNAKEQVSLWGPVVASIIKEGGGGGAGGGGAGAAAPSGGGTLTSSTPGTYNATHSIRPMRRRKKKKIMKAPEVNDEDTDDISHIMSSIRRFIDNENRSLTPKEIMAEFPKVTEDMLDKFANEYGIERAEDGKWTLNEAIDDDIIENFAFPRMNRASADGGAWSGMQADITAPTGPTQVTDEENTTFGNPRQGEFDERDPLEFKPMQMRVMTEDGPVVIRFQGETAIVEIPPEKKPDTDSEINVQEANRVDEVI